MPRLRDLRGGDARDLHVRAGRERHTHAAVPRDTRFGEDAHVGAGARERGVMTPLVVAMLVLGIWSAPLVSALTPVAQDLDLANSQVPAAAEGSAQ